MKYGLLVAGTAAAGISAAYLLDEKRGPKRRRMLKKTGNQVLHQAAHKWNDYSQDLRPYWDRYSKEVTQQANKWKEQSLQRVEKVTQNGWTPSARMLGVMASALAFYAAGRKGFTGTMLRLVSLGLFTRALMASK